MKEQLRENYFMAIRIGLLAIVEIYIVLSQALLTGTSAKVFLFLALFLGTAAARELAEKRKKIFFYVISVILLLIMMQKIGREVLVLGVLLCYDIFSYVRPRITWYFVPILAAFIPSGMDVYVQTMIILLLCIIYIQHDFVVESYRKQTMEDTISEQHLKRNLYQREYEMQEEIQKSLLMAENQILEERSQLSQTLHDKLGHNINGSVYQLEAVKILMEKEPETARKMVQAVIEQLRTGMDEIRAILRKERPKKYKLAILQLEKLCEDCQKKGVNARLLIEGELEKVPEKYLEIILDNTYEAVSNSMKYAKCTKDRKSVV